MLLFTLYAHAAVRMKSIIYNKKVNSMNIYYIDYENVTSQGLKGIELLTEADEVNLLYSKKAETMKIDMLSQLIASRASIRFLPVHVGTPNALDFQLITLLFLHYTSENNYYIISKDSGYDCCIKTAQENNAPNVFRFPNIESAVNGGQKMRSQRSRRGSDRNRQNANEAASLVKEADVQARKAEAQAPKTEDPMQNTVTQVQKAETPAPETGALTQEAAAEQITGSVSLQEQTAGPEEVMHFILSAEEVSSMDADTPSSDLPQSLEETPAEESGRKRPARRRGRRKSGASQQAQPEAEEAAEPKAEATEEARELTRASNDQPKEQDRADQNQSQSRRENQGQKRGQQTKENNRQKQSQPARQAASHQETEKNDKPVTILSVIRRRNDVQLDLNQIDLIRAALKNTSNKQQFYNYFAKKLGQKKGIELYHSIKSSYTDLMNANLI